MASIVITGAAGFIGSCLAGRFNRGGHRDLLLVDDFSNPKKAPYLSGKRFAARVHREELMDWLQHHSGQVEMVFHIGARTDTAEQDLAVFEKLNLAYSKALWQWCAEQHVPLVYASSAATYGLGEHGFVDEHNITDQLQPLNPYGVSKNEFDKWALRQPEQPPRWAGLKFFNVYGPNEYHKGRMASVVFHAFRQINATGRVRLFRSHCPDYEAGKQLRDFIYVKDVLEVCHFLYRESVPSGLYNVGTGKARTFLDLAHALFRALQLPPDIEFIDTPPDIRDQYQYFTEAHIQKLRSAGFGQPFYSLEAGIADYVKNYLVEEKHY